MAPKTNTTAGSMAQKVSGIWTVTYTLPTNAGADGTVLYGTGVPGSATGKNSDTYINTTTGIFYKKNSGNWAQVFSMQTGPAGATGPQGSTGASGANGKTILSGTTNPSNLYTGTNGDYYINTTNYTFFGPKAAGTWPTGFPLDNGESDAINDEAGLRAAADEALQEQIDTKINAINGYGLSQNNYTTTEKNKLANLSEHFKGNYTTAIALTTSNPSATIGDYAFVDLGSGHDAKMYIWDNDNNTWVLSSGGGIIPDATENTSGIVELATIAEALARTDDQRAMTALKTIGLILDEKKNVHYQISPVSLNEVSFLMRNSGNVTAITVAGASNAKLKIGLGGTYPTSAQTFPFAYAAGDRVFATYNYADLNNASCNLILTCRDN
jgi:hypothetical protein